MFAGSWALVKDKDPAAPSNDPSVRLSTRTAGDVSGTSKESSHGSVCYVS